MEACVKKLLCLRPLGLRVRGGMCKKIIAPAPFGATGALRLYNISPKNNSIIMTKNKTVKQKKASAFTQSKLFLSFEDVRDDDKTIS